MHEKLHIALVGNPNSGKSSLFNSFTGLNQKVGNFPGVTVDKKTGGCRLNEKWNANMIDLPGTYSLYPKSADEMVTYDILLNPDSENHPDIIVIVADASNLKRNLLFCSQIIDLKIPTVIGLTMMDLARKNGTEIDLQGLERELGVPIMAINPRKNKGISQLKKTLILTAEKQYRMPAHSFVQATEAASGVIEGVSQFVPVSSPYAALHIASNVEALYFLNGGQRLAIQNVLAAHEFNKSKIQGKEVLQRYARIKQIMGNTVTQRDPLYKKLITEKIDNLLLHRVWGYVIMAIILLFIFQCIFSFAEYPMDAIEWGFSQLGSWLGHLLPAGWFTDLLINGLIAGVSGVAVFIPQIMILFGFITLLEDTGYMARISFLTDRIMRQSGLNGRSVMPLVSGIACAVPAIMATRSIENKKERLITILVTPLMPCSARLPIYVIIISLIIPSTYLWGFMSLQGLVMMGMYFVGFFMSMLAAFIMKFIIRVKGKSHFIMELPTYRMPRWKNVLTTMVEKGKIFVVEAGKIILIISLVLWFMASYGPGNKISQIENHYTAEMQAHPDQTETLQQEMQGEKLENSFAGYLGKAVEPVIRPLGFDWKIGIALITSFAAREVFVGTMATIYSVGDNPNLARMTLTEKMQNARHPDGTKVFTLATGLSLMLFYAFAMQCMSTLAIVKRETKGWKIPAIQFAYMTGLAYIFSLVAFQLLA